jgi:tetratricopeptide (TPR) repeat protein
MEDAMEEGASAESQTKYRLAHELGALGPVDAPRVAQLVKEGKLFRTSIVQVGDDPEWRPLGAIEAFADLFPAASAPAPGAAPVMNSAAAQAERKFTGLGARVTQILGGFTSVAVLVVAAVRLFGSDSFPGCDSRTAKELLSDIFKKGGLDYGAYETIKTESTSSEENTCYATLKRGDGGLAEFRYRMWKDGKIVNLKITEARDLPAPGAAPSTPPDAKAQQAAPATPAAPAQAGPGADEDPEKACADTGQPDAALRNCRRIVEDPSRKPEIRATAYQNIGRIQIAKGTPDQAVAAFSSALALDPKLSDAFGDRGNAYYMQRDFSRAVKDYSEAVKLNPEDVNGFNNRGCAYVQLNSLRRAEADFARAKKLGRKGAGSECQAEYKALKARR